MKITAISAQIRNPDRVNVSIDGKYTVQGVRFNSASRAAVVRFSLGLKRCSKCGGINSVDLFPKASKRKDGLHPHCKQCLALYRESVRERRRDNQPDKGESC